VDQPGQNLADSDVELEFRDTDQDGVGDEEGESTHITSP
jgi:hypothetical protein